MSQLCRTTIFHYSNKSAIKIHDMQHMRRAVAKVYKLSSGKSRHLESNAENGSRAAP